MQSEQNSFIDVRRERCVSFDGLFVLNLEETVWRKYGGGISLSEYPAKRNR